LGRLRGKKSVNGFDLKDGEGPVEARKGGGGDQYEGKRTRRECQLSRGYRNDKKKKKKKKGDATASGRNFKLKGKGIAR